MRHPIFQCCVLVSLLVARLLFGEIAHATPHQMMVTGSEAAAELSIEQDCPDHGAHSLPADLMPEATGHLPDTNSLHSAFLDTSSSQDQVVGEASSGNSHCCEVGECECLCVHTAAAAAPCLTMELGLIARAAIPSGTAGLIQSRPSLLFRPPAA